MTTGLFRVLTATTLLVLSPPLLSAADDGPLFQRNLSRTPELHSEHAAINVMPLYLPAQDTQGEPPDTTSGEIEYYVGDCTYQDPNNCTLASTRPEAKPLIATYLDGDVTFIGDLMFPGHGRREAFAAHSLDDGATWKEMNLSRSGDLSSFKLADGTDYPGDVVGISTAVVGNRVFVAWQSRYCDSGKPLYAWYDEEKIGLLSAYPELDHPVPVDGGTDPDGYQLYFDDLFSVAGTQRSSDFADEGYPEVGEVPYTCLWTARGTLEQALDDDSGEPLTNTIGDPVYDITWRAAERVTSGVRDVNLVQVAGTRGSGFVVVWQEDPEGLRPGKGLCLDGGFNGAVAHHGTDIWYSYISWDHFSDVCVDSSQDAYCTPGALAEFIESPLFGEKPNAAVPMAVPVRLTDSEECKGTQKFDTNGDLLNPYCYADFDDNGTADFCAETLSWTNPGGTTLDVCQTEDERVLTGRRAATRPRIELRPYDSDADGAPDSAWLVVIHERNKAMGTEIPDEEEEPIDIGKDIWYRTFDMFNPELVSQGMMLNSYALDPLTGEHFEIYVDEWENEYYETEISRHANLTVQGIGDAMASPNRTSAILIYKQGIINQGGPADIFVRRVVLPDDFDPAVDNPFAYENVQCVEIAEDATTTPVDRLYSDGSNPNYVRGLCPVQGMNVSGTTIVECDGETGDCADQFPWADGDGDYPKVTEWVQAETNLNDPSWANPYDVSKDNQGFIDGDFVMLLYSTAPNWKASTIGREAYNLYARRSFDGGQTWTTLPASYTHIDGTTWNGDGTETCEWYPTSVGGKKGQVKPGGDEFREVCTIYGPGDFEQARNLSLLTGYKVSVLDPRYSPTGGVLKTDYERLLCYDETADDGNGDWTNCAHNEAPYPEENRDPSVYFVAYGTGDNETVTEDTGPEPMDLYYSRAFEFGDDYDVVEFTTSSGLLVERWDWLEQGKLSSSSDADLTANPDGSRLYAIWGQEDFNKRGDLVGSDAWWRRVFYNLE